MKRKKTLEYNCPSYGGWGMVRSGMLVPESCQLFVSPPACGRHGALGAVRQGFKDRLFYLCLEESDIVSGYDQAILETTEELFLRLLHRPKVLLIFVSCLDDLIGTDGEAVVEALSERFPDVKFRVCHMNPLANDSEEPPLVSLWKNVYSLMERKKEQPEKKINVIGSYRPVSQESELFSFLKYAGIEEICHIGNCRNYEEFRDMGNNCMNLVAAASAQKAAEEIWKKNGMEYLNLPVSYHFEKIEENYMLLWKKLAELGMHKKEKETLVEELLKNRKKDAVAAVALAKEKVSGRKIYLDDSAFAAPFAAARFLLESGFLVGAVYVSEWNESDADYQWILENTDTEICNVRVYTMVEDWKTEADTVAIGLEAAYISGSDYVVSLFQDEGMYGFEGVTQLMRRIIDCMTEKADLPALIEQSGFVV